MTTTRKRPTSATAVASSLTHFPLLRRGVGGLCGCLLLAAGVGGSLGFQRPSLPPLRPPPPSSPQTRLLAAAANDPFLFRTPVPLDPLPPALRIRHAEPVVLLGSCFSDNIGSRLQALKYTVDINPMGISYNPISLQRCLLRLLEGRPFEAAELGRHPRDGVFYSFDHHTSFSSPDPDAALAGINARLHAGRQALLRAKHVFLTLGTAHVYEWVGEEEKKEEKNGRGSSGRRVVANCHRLPQHLFARRLLGVEEIVGALEDALRRLRTANPGVAVTLTVSPVRHLRNAQGPVANARSKAHLLTAVHELIDRSSRQKDSKGKDCKGEQQEQPILLLPPLFYAPAYEIMMDELRDYRFYDADMLHPSPLAVDFIFDALQQSHLAAATDPKERELLKTLRSLQAGLAHRPSDPRSAAHQAFLRSLRETMADLRRRHPHLDLVEEEERVAAALVG